MYGIVNSAIQDLIRESFGEEKLAAIQVHSGVKEDFFVSNEPYDDAITYKLAMSAAAVLNLPLETVLQSFGEWWVLRTGREKYGSLMSAGGSNLKEFLINLPVFHNRIAFIYPKLSPPEFQITNISESGLHIHYHSKREGLREFVRGLLQGLGKMYETPVTIELLQSREEGNDHEIFNVSWS